jgi:hypothetical protein
VTRYADIVQVERSPEIFSSARSITVVRALTRELECVGAADAAAGAGHDHDASLADPAHRWGPLSLLSISLLLVSSVGRWLRRSARTGITA